MRVFKTRRFARFAKDEDIDDEQLADAIREIELGLVNADLGGGLIKQRVARRGSGKRGGYRTLIAYRTGARAVFLFGFAKNERENIAPDQVADLKSVAADILNRSGSALDDDITEGRLKEVDYNG